MSGSEVHLVEVPGRKEYPPPVVLLCARQLLVTTHGGEIPCEGPFLDCKGKQDEMGHLAFACSKVEAVWML